MTEPPLDYPAPELSKAPKSSGPTGNGRRATETYVGLSERARLWILGLGATIACLNLLVAWYIAGEAMSALRLVEADVQPFYKLLSDAQLNADGRHDLAARSMHIVALTKSIANKQGLVLACFGGAFALAAIGFSLFVIGADGAFKISATSVTKARIVMSGTAPGLLCFAICGWLVQQGIQQRSAMDLPPFAATPILAIQEPAATQACARTDIQGRCYSIEEWNAKLKSLKETKP